MLRSATSGVVGAAIDLSAMACLVEGMRLGYGVAAACASLVGAIACFALNRYWAFRDVSPLRASQLGQFAALAAGTMLIVAPTVQLLAGAMHVPYIVAKIVAAIAAFAIWTYPMQARIFAPKEPHAHEA